MCVFLHVHTCTHADRHMHSQFSHRLRIGVTDKEGKDEEEDNRESEGKKDR